MYTASSFYLLKSLCTKWGLVSYLDCDAQCMLISLAEAMICTVSSCQLPRLRCTMQFHFIYLRSHFTWNANYNASLFHLLNLWCTMRYHFTYLKSFCTVCTYLPRLSCTPPQQPQIQAPIKFECFKALRLKTWHLMTH